MPPCRLIQVVEGGDYGYQFRYGRTGRHPFQAWDGQLPGTLPMLAGTGEAPCAAAAWGGWLWVTSWGDNRIERYSLQPAGATLSARREVVVQGDARFRPVDFALAPDGSLYFTDWVDVSYPLHGAGRLWRLAWREASAESGAWPMLSVDEQRAARLRATLDWTALDDPDAFVRQAAVWNLAQRKDLAGIDPFQRPTAQQRLGVLQALRWRSRDLPLPPDQIRNHLAKALQEDDAAVRLFAIRWIADAGINELLPQVEAQWNRADVDARYILAVLAALDWLQEGTAQENRAEHNGRLLQLAGDGQRPVGLRVAALRAVSGELDQAAVTTLAELVDSALLPVQREAARSLALAEAPQARAKCAELVQRPDLPSQARADLVLALEEDPSARSVLEQLRHDPGPLGAEVRRALENPPSTSSATDGGAVASAEDTDRWLAILGEGPGDTDAGWRLFFSTNGPRCGTCHSYQGRSREPSGSGTVGPDLTAVGQRLAGERLVESILQPGREVAPQFVPWVIEMEDGRIFTGLSLGRFDGEKYERFVGADGGTFVLQTSQIARRDAAEISIMPSGLEQTLSTQQLRDLLAFLTQGSIASDL
jgi:putative heme-binding domain-containing protein